jgi:hypothetical protein
VRDEDVTLPTNTGLDVTPTLRLPGPPDITIFPPTPLVSVLATGVDEELSPIHNCPSAKAGNGMLALPPDGIKLTDLTYKSTGELLLALIM